MKNIIINIDDLGLSDAVNQAVVNLAEKQRITATSYMVGGSITDEHKQALQKLGIDIGLHLDFTGIFPSPLTGSLKSTLLKTYTRQFDKQHVADNIKQQFDQFEETFGSPPIFVDGHQHVHQFPVIRDALITEIISRSYYQDIPIACRITKPLVNDIKSWIIYALGGNKWQKICQQQQIVTNRGFAGVYGFDKNSEELKHLWKKWLSSSPEYSDKADKKSQTSLIMCHPATPISLTMPPSLTKLKDEKEEWQDEIKQAREIEYQWMMSDAFAEMLEHHEVELSCWGKNEYQNGYKAS